jgi:hypothetical protein
VRRLRETRKDNRREERSKEKERNGVKTGILKTCERMIFMRFGVLTAMNINIRPTAVWIMWLYNLVPTRCHDVTARKTVVMKVKTLPSSWQLNAPGYVRELLRQLARQKANTSLGRTL